METAGAELARSLSSADALRGSTIALSGELGAGKTTFCRGFIRACGYSGRVKSPTYTLLEQYELDAATICHLDLYRLVDPEELEFIGFRDLLQARPVLLVEWAERVPELQRLVNLRVSIEHNDNRSRLLSITRSE
ncbi:tRNA (adenosine(37)-N6)-threonylcarbamoyltransferase complex ATPase subunit type 1 TsaE [Chromatiales bacterium (ex Bugula neritina AB1)]|nr:tRNA (adenosine(37)-N6)-threonylcarbamoyltransferase complex ATPase subunit type 1 TsaE [Chromatiales bacterium (ex Bugula neritina AB1)]